MGVNDRFHVRVPVVGVLRTKESTVKLLSALDDGRARILKATLSTRAGRWYISFAVDLDRKLKVPKNPNSVVGIDVGIKRLATVVNDKGDVVARVENPAPLKKNLRKLARLQRSLARRQKRTATRQASQRYKKQAKKVARLHFRVANVRNDACHKFTTGVMSQHGVNVVEKLNVAGMAKNRRLARAVADSGLGQIRLMCLSKKSRFDTTVVEADQWFPSSKLCSACGDKNTQLTLSDRKWVCQACGVLHDRDENAGLNLARYLATASAAGSAALNRKARGEGGRPNSVRRPSWKREARSPKKLQSGSASEVIGAHDPVPENDTKL
jgi:putative transposase